MNEDKNRRRPAGGTGEAERSGGGRRVAAATAQQRGGEGDVDGGHGEDRGGEDPDAQLPPEGRAARAEGVELVGGGLGERGQQAPRARAQAPGTAQLRQDQLHLREDGGALGGGGVGGRCDLGEGGAGGGGDRVAGRGGDDGGGGGVVVVGVGEAGDGEALGQRGVRLLLRGGGGVVIVVGEELAGLLVSSGKSLEEVIDQARGAGD